MIDFEATISEVLENQHESLQHDSSMESKLYTTQKLHLNDSNTAMGHPQLQTKRRPDGLLIPNEKYGNMGFEAEREFDFSEHLNMDMLDVISSPTSESPLSDKNDNVWTDRFSSDMSSGSVGSSPKNVKIKIENNNLPNNTTVGSFPVNEFGNGTLGDHDEDVDFNPDDWVNTSNLQCGMNIAKIPVKSRVETQIKIVMDIYPPPQEQYIHLPTGTIAKPKLQMKERFTPSSDTLLLDTIVVCEGEKRKAINMCKGCINRERKRALRKKIKSPTEEAYWNEDVTKKISLYNCKEILEMKLEDDFEEAHSGAINSRRVELPLRLACYCRHHDEKTGFRVYFQLRNYRGQVVARGMTTPVMITDDHKAMVSSSQRPAYFGFTGSRDIKDMYIPSKSSEEINNQTCKKRKKSSQDEDMHSIKGTVAFSINKPLANIPSDQVMYRHNSKESLNSVMTEHNSPGSSTWSSGVNTAATSPQSNSELDSVIPQSTTTSSLIRDRYADGSLEVPVVNRVIPSSGSIRGGMEVTLLGSGFTNELVAKFGDNKSVATHCWNSSTVITYLPPAQVPGHVLVTFDGFSANSDSQVFTYTDDCDRQLIELALQLVGMKMNGKLEDARDIAKRIIGNTEEFDASQLQQRLASAGNMSLSQLEGYMLSCVRLMDAYSRPESSDYFELSNKEGQTMLHLASILGLEDLCMTLVEKGAIVDVVDKNGMTPLHFAAMHGFEDIADLYINNAQDLFAKTFLGKTVLDLASDELAHSLILRYMPMDWSSVAGSRRSSEVALSRANSFASETSELHQRIATPEGQSRSFIDYISGLRDHAMNSYNELIGNEEQVVQALNTVWAYFVPEHYFSNGTESQLVEQAPPSYDEIYPQGSATVVDYSSSVIETKEASKPKNEPQEVNEDEMIQAWKDKRRGLSNDKMLFFFWLPGLILTMIWLYHVLATGSSDSSSQFSDSIREAMLAIMKTMLGVKRQTGAIVSALTTDRLRGEDPIAV